VLTLIGLGFSIGAIAAYSNTNTGNNSGIKVNSSVIDAIGLEESQYKDVQGISDLETFKKLGYGDCWADSEWLYNKLNAVGVPARIMGYENGGTGPGYRHTWIEINIGDGWQQWNYKKYNSQHYGDVSGGTPYVLISPSQNKADILSTGY